MKAIERSTFTDAMRHIATPVSVITTDGPGGRFGVTVSSVCTASADPPQMLACIHLAGPTPAALRENGVFAVNLLGSRHGHVADSFAGRIARWRSDRFACDHWDILVTGSPCLQDGLVVLDCRLVSELVISTHVAFVGEVVGLRTAPGLPMLYANQGYSRPHDPLSVQDPEFTL